MKNNTPKNHHFVPQHFLRAWCSSEGKIYRYRFIPNTHKFEVKEVGIKNTASIQDLYKIKFPDGSFEIESSLVTPQIDDIGHKIIEKIRSTPLLKWSHSDKEALANYLTCLEARHPDIIETMNVGSELERLRNQIKAEGFARDESVDAIVDYLKESPSMGVMAFAYFLQNEKKPFLQKPFSYGLVSAQIREYSFESDSLISSNYPTARWGDYLKDFLFVVAISPNKAIVYSTNFSIDVLTSIPESVRRRLINLYSLAKANVAYFKDESETRFIEEHLGWASNFTSLQAQQKYVGEFIEAELIKVGYV